MKFVGVTACPTGIAHSAMAAEALETTAKDMDHDIEIEIHGASGAEFVDRQVIRDADAIIIAADATVAERNRFEGKPQVEVRLREAMDKPEEVIHRAERAAEQGRSEESAGAVARRRKAPKQKPAMERRPCPRPWAAPAGARR